MLFLEIIASLVLFLNKVEMRKGNPHGWILGMDGALLFGLVCYQKALWINLGYLAGFLILLGYGYFLAVTEWGRRNGFWQFFIKIAIISTILVSCLFLFFATYHLKNFTWWQLISAVGGLWGTFFLALENIKFKILGWKAYIVSHLATMYIGWQKDLWFILAFQLVSIGIAVKSIKELRQRPSTSGEAF